MNRELMKDFLRETFPNPERVGCPEEDVLQALAGDRISPNDPALLHVSSCSECYAEYLNLRQDVQEALASTLPGSSFSEIRPSTSDVLEHPARSGTKTHSR